MNVQEKDVLLNFGISKTTYHKIWKKKLKFRGFKIEKNAYFELFGTGIIVQVDEMVFSHASLVTHPSQLNEDEKVKIWLVGIIELHTSKIKYEMVKNRKQEIMINLFKKW